MLGGRRRFGTLGAAFDYAHGGFFMTRHGRCTRCCRSRVWAAVSNGLKHSCTSIETRDSSYQVMGPKPLSSSDTATTTTRAATYPYVASAERSRLPGYVLGGSPADTRVSRPQSLDSVGSQKKSLCVRCVLLTAMSTRRANQNNQ